MDHGVWGERLPPGMVLQQGSTPDQVLGIVEGRLDVRAGGQTLRTMVQRVLGRGLVAKLYAA